MTNTTQHSASTNNGGASHTREPSLYEIAEALLGPGISPENVHVASFPGNLKDGGADWGGRRLKSETDHLSADNNNYICMSPLDETMPGRPARAVSEHTCFWMDDVGTKVHVERVQQLIDDHNLAPTLVVETSPGNYSYFWGLDAPVDAADVSGTQTVLSIRRLLKSGGWGDPNVQDPVHYMRLPGGINGKSMHRDPATGEPFRTRTVVFASECTVTLDAFGKALAAASFHEGAGDEPKQLPRSEGGDTEDAGKVGWPAPSADILRMALDRLPNGPGGPFDARSDWVNMGHAVKGAAVEGGIETEGREIWLDWSSQNGGDTDHDADFWDSCHSTHVGWGYIMRTLERVNPKGYAEVEQAVHNEGKAAFKNTPIDPMQLPLLLPAPVSHNRAVLRLAPVSQFNPRAIPPRRLWYGTSTIAGYVSMLVAPGGSGKSALSFSEVVAMASGRELLPGERPVRRLRVWVHNAEDDIEEMLRRLAATLTLHNLSHADLNNNLFLTSGRDLDIKLARQTHNGPEIDQAAVNAVIEVARAAAIDVIVFDPLGAMHTLPENSNEAANLLAGALRHIAHETGAAVILLHHASKFAAMDMDTAGASASRGASAFTDAARNVRQLVRMSETEAARFGISSAARRSYFRVENGKANMSPAADAQWVRIVGVPLHNGASLWPLGDTVGAAERWTPPGPVVGTVSELLRVQQAIAAAGRRPRASNKSPEWIGYLVGRVLGMDIGSPSSTQKSRPAEQGAARAKVESMVQNWIERDGLRVVRDHDPVSRKPMTFIDAGEPALPFEEDEPIRAAA